MDDRALHNPNYVLALSRASTGEALLISSPDRGWLCLNICEVDSTLL